MLAEDQRFLLVWLRMVPQDELFSGEADLEMISSREGSDDGSSASKPLAARMRPRSLSEVIGQDHVLGKGKLLPKLVESNSFGSLLFYGPRVAVKQAWQKPSPTKRKAGLSESMQSCRTLQNYGKY